MHRKALGKGLGALFPSNDTSSRDGDSGISFNATKASKAIINVPIKNIIANRSQPREVFTDKGMEELKQSIVENGILEPPVVRRKGDLFELIAGERRFRAASELNYETLDVIVMDVESEDKMIVLSLIENIQREDLNAIEEGKAYQKIMSEMNITQDECSKIVGKSRSAIANTLRLLSLPSAVQKMVGEGLLAPGSARALVIIEDENLQMKLARIIASEGLSARKAEELVKQTIKPKTAPATKKMEIAPFLESVREDLQRVIGTSIKIKDNDGKGKIEIEYYSHDDLERILETIKGEPLG